MSDFFLRAARLLAVIAGSWVVGIALCVMKGDTGGLLNTLGNLSAPYGITALIAGLNTRRYWSGALAGIAATEATLGGFYWAYAALPGHDVQTSTLSIWCSLGLALGAACGLIGHAGVGRPALWYAIPGLLHFEPLALRVEGPHTLPACPRNSTRRTTDLSTPPTSRSLLMSAPLKRCASR